MWSEPTYIGTILYRSPCSIEWSIKYHKLSRTCKSYDEFQSPPFKAMGRMWFILIYSRTDVVYECIDLKAYLVKDKAVIDQNIWFKVKQSIGKEFAVYRSCFNRANAMTRCGNYILPYRCEFWRKEYVTFTCDFQTEMELAQIEHTEGKEKHEEKDLDKKEQVKEDEKSIFHETTGLEKMSQDFKDLLLTGEDSDMTVKVNDSEFQVHKLILSARSPVFASMFKHDMKEKNRGVINISDFTADAIYDFLLYLYSGKLKELPRENIFDLYLAADKYDVKDLKSTCVRFMTENLSVDTFCDIFSIALRHEESILLETVSKFFAKNLKDVIVTVKWKTFLKENPMEANDLYIKALNNVMPN